MNVNVHIKCETPVVIYELYMSITHVSFENLKKQSKKEFYRSLGERALAEQGSLHGVYEAIDRMKLLLQLESRVGNIRHKYPHLEKHEIVELLYDLACSI